MDRHGQTDEPEHSTHVDRLCRRDVGNKLITDLFAQLQMLLNLNVEVSVGLLLGKVALETDNGRLSEVC